MTASFHRLKKGMASVRGDWWVKQGTANLAEDYCFIHKALRPVSKARRQIAAMPPSNSRRRRQIRGLLLFAACSVLAMLLDNIQ